MAVLFRCALCPPSSVSPSESRRRRVDRPAKAPDVTLQIQHGKVPISYSKMFMKFEVPFDAAKILSSCRSMSFPPDFFQFIKLKEVDNASRRMPDHAFIIDTNYHHQVDSVRWFAGPAEKRELARLNDQLRQINAALRRQAKIESYAPTLSYAPVSRVSEADVVVDPRKEQLLASLRTGKNFLRNQEPDKAFAEFKAAFELAQNLGDHIDEKKAARGLGASLQRQGKYREAIKYHSKVLEIAKRAGEDSGSTEAYGAIADCYTELGDLERAGKFYDKYIARLESD